MNHDIQLFLCGQLCDLSADPKILFSYKVTDTTKPMAVKNGFTKTVTLDGTATNNEIFGHIWDLSRLQEYGNGNYYGTEFNPLKKADFTLMIDSCIYETGYFKLTDVTKTGKNIQYTIQLFGGLGDFIHNLSTTDGGNALEFKDLDIVDGRNDPYFRPDMSFDITKDEVSSAWTHIKEDKYASYNFAPCYNGTPGDNFESDKILMNIAGRPSTLNNLTLVTSNNGWALGKADRGLNEYEAHDLRSHMQRPVLRVKTLLESCFYPDNNGGYEVSLDEHFFNSDNPYYWDAWVTCPMIKDMQGTDEESSSEITGATITRDPSTGLYDINTTADFSNFSNLSMDIVINASGDSNTANQLYTSTSKRIHNTVTLQNRFVKDYYFYYSSILLQLIAYDELGQVVGASKAYQLTSKVDTKDPYEWMDLSSFISYGSDVNVPDIETLFGYFQNNGTSYTWTDYDGNTQAINFRFPASLKYYKLKLKVVRPYFEEFKMTGVGSKRKTNSPDYAQRLYDRTSEKIYGNYEPNDVISSGATTASLVPAAGSFHATSTRYGGFTSGIHVPQSRLLTLGITPADFLVSYIKLFGLYLWKDPVEKKIYIADRNSYYTGETNEINRLIDRGKPIKTTPQVAAARWYDFNTEQHESAANTQYKDTYGTDYGLQRTNTSYEFDNNTEQVYDGVFKGGIQVLGKSPYYYADFDNWPVWCYNGFTITQFTSGIGGRLNGNQREVNIRTGVFTTPWNNTYPGFDCSEKLQFHTKDGEPTDGSLVLVFLNDEKKDVSAAKLFITDDTDEMIIRNGGKPCWLNTNQENDSSGNRIGIAVTQMPDFTRMLYWKYNGFITHTWDFGQTQETYVPGTYYTKGCSIYERFWKSYIADMYSVNTRILNCRMLIQGQVSSEMLRKYYIWDNCLWRLNAIKEHDPGSYDTTAVEFLKINDKNNYKLSRCTKDPELDFWLRDYTPTSYVEYPYSRYRTYVLPTGVTEVTGCIEIQDGGPWSFGDGAGSMVTIQYDNSTIEQIPYSSITASHTDHGSGNKAEVFSIPNTQPMGRTITMKIVIYGTSGDYWRYIEIYQPAGTAISGITATRIDSGNIPMTGGTASLRVISDTPWTGTTQWLGDTAPLPTLSPSSGPSGVTSVTMTFGDHSQYQQMTSRATFTNSNSNSTYVDITQNGQSGQTYTISLSSGLISFSYEGESKTFTVTANSNWELSGPEWITFSQTTGGSGQTTVTATAEENTNRNLRSDTVGAWITASPTISASMNVLQYGAPAYINVQRMDSGNIPYSGGSAVFKVTANTPWLASADWLEPCTTDLMLAPTSGDSGITAVILRFGVAESYSEETARATFNIIGERTVTMDVTQDPEPHILIDTTQGYQFDYTGGTLTCTVCANADWEIYECPAWLTLSQMSGNGYASSYGCTAITMTAPQNDTQQDRDGFVRARFVNDHSQYDGTYVIQFTGGPHYDNLIYSFNGSCGLNTVELSIGAESYGSYVDETPIGPITGDYNTDTGSIEIYAQSGTQITLYVSFDDATMHQYAQGYFEFRLRYGSLDTGYEALTVGDRLTLQTTYTAGQLETLYVDMVWVDTT